MKNRKIILILFILALPVILAACTGTNATVAPTAAESLVLPSTQPEDPTSAPAEETRPTPQDAALIPEDGDMSREDSQGNITIVVTPLNLNQPGETLDFRVSLDTHSVDLSMDLAKFATLKTDDGITVQPVIWDAPMGGHHVSGTLSFPNTYEGKPLLGGARTLTLTLTNVDAPERVFTWQLD